MKNINPKNFKFCPVCSGDLIEIYLGDEKETRLVCNSCGYIFYTNPTPAAAVILIRDKKIVLVKRKFNPRIGDWTLPAGFMEYNETSEETAIRETKEETNLDIKIKELFAVLPGFDDSRVHVILIVYVGEIKGGDLLPGDDAVEVKFFPLDELPDNIAFSAHREVLKRLNE